MSLKTKIAAYILRPAVSRMIARAAARVLPSTVMKNKDHFFIWEKRGYHVIPVHFYEPVPDTSTIQNSVWSRESDLVGIDMNEDAQLALLELFEKEYRAEYETFPLKPTGPPPRFYLNNMYYGRVDAEILYCMVRHFKPRKIIEIGSGHTTLLMAQALEKNREQDKGGSLVAIDPHPGRDVVAGFPGFSELVREDASRAPMGLFEGLGPNDLLFIDSSHVATIGNDVQRLYLEIIPRLKKGVVVHVHDVFMPREYPKTWALLMKWFFNEQYLLQAFLTFNHSFEVLWAGSYMHLNHPERLLRAFTSYDPKKNWPHSFWMIRTG